MSETLTIPQPQERIDPALAAEWYSVADQIAPFNQHTVINRGNGPEEFVLRDVVGKQVHDEAGNRIDSIPTVVLAREDGTIEDFDAADFLTYVGADSFGLRHIIDEAKLNSQAQVENRVELWGGAVYAGETAVKAVADAQSPQEKESYDYLFDIAKLDETQKTHNDTEHLSTTEIQKDPRLEVLFAPVMSIEEYRNKNPQEDHGYDHLFMDDGPERDAIIAKISAENRMQTIEGNNYTQITDESRKAASVQLLKTRKSDATIDKILRIYEQQHAETVNLSEAIRTDTDLRYQLGEYLLKTKMPNRITHMPDRIVRNTQKNPNHRGYSKYRGIMSREYATLLALSMLDGTYSGTPKGDEMESHPVSGDIIVGQHRAAALELLN